MNNRTLLFSELNIATLAGRILPLVKKNPEVAYAKALSKVVEPVAAPHSSHETMVGAALRYLEQKGYVTSEKALNPNRTSGKVKLYDLTPEGAFILALSQTK